MVAACGTALNNNEEHVDQDLTTRTSEEGISVSSAGGEDDMISNSITKNGVGCAAKLLNEEVTSQNIGDMSNSFKNNSNNSKKISKKGSNSSKISSNSSNTFTKNQTKIKSDKQNHVVMKTDETKRKQNIDMEQFSKSSSRTQSSLDEMNGNSQSNNKDISSSSTKDSPSSKTINVSSKTSNITEKTAASVDKKSHFNAVALMREHMKELGESNSKAKNVSQDVSKGRTNVSRVDIEAETNISHNVSNADTTSSQSPSKSGHNISQSITSKVSSDSTSQSTESSIQNVSFVKERGVQNVSSTTKSGVQNVSTASCNRKKASGGAELLYEGGEFSEKSKKEKDAGDMKKPASPEVISEYLEGKVIQLLFYIHLGLNILTKISYFFPHFLLIYSSFFSAKQ